MGERGAEKGAITYDMIRERDHYRACCQIASERIERDAGKVLH